jgi:hypothetical protein
VTQVSPPNPAADNETPTPAADVPVADVPAADVPAEPARGDSPALDRTIRVAGIVISLLAAVLSGALELFLTTLRLGGVLVGVSIPMAVAGNAAIAWFAVTTTGRRWALGLPWAVWTLMMVFAAGARTTEGDYLVSGDNWIALIMILTGSLTFAVYSYRMILSRPPVTKL